MNIPNMPPSAKPMTPETMVFPMQDSMPACIWEALVSTKRHVPDAKGPYSTLHLHLLIGRLLRHVAESPARKAGRAWTIHGDLGMRCITSSRRN